ncbi:MAG: hypothetical protein ABIB71_08180 [Candidatus Woesearchaeota archaeon]
MKNKEWKKICEGCYCPPLNVALLKYADTPEYLRRLCALMAIKEFKINEP